MIDPEVDRLIRRYHPDEYRGILSALRRYRRKVRRLRWPSVHPTLMGGDRGPLQWLCGIAGRRHGGRPPPEQRCTKRLGTRFCWNWRSEGTDRCWRHPR